MAKGIVDIRSLARVHTEMCIRTLANIARSAKAPESARVVAANSLLDRGWGKANTTHAGPDGGAIQVVIRQIIDITGEKRSMPVVIDGDAGVPVLGKRSLT